MLLPDIVLSSYVQVGRSCPVHLVLYMHFLHGLPVSNLRTSKQSILLWSPITILSSNSTQCYILDIITPASLLQPTAHYLAPFKSHRPSRQYASTEVAGQSMATSTTQSASGARMSDFSFNHANFVVPLHTSMYRDAHMTGAPKNRKSPPSRPGPPEQGIFELLGELCCLKKSKKATSQGQLAEQRWLAELERSRGVASSQQPQSQPGTRFALVPVQGQTLADSQAGRNGSVANTLVSPLANIQEESEPDAATASIDATDIGTSSATDAARAAWLMRMPGPSKRAQAREARQKRNAVKRPGKITEEPNVTAVDVNDRDLYGLTSSDENIPEDGADQNAFPDAKHAEKAGRRKSLSSMNHRAVKALRKHTGQGQDTSTHDPRKQLAALVDAIWSRFRPMLKKREQMKNEPPMMELTTMSSQPASSNPNTSEIIRVGRDDMSGAVLTLSRTTTQDLRTHDSTSRTDNNDGPGKILLSRVPTRNATPAPEHVEEKEHEDVPVSQLTRAPTKKVISSEMRGSSGKQ